MSRCVTALSPPRQACDHAAVTGAAAAERWCLYLLECRNGSYYTGITNDLPARFLAHSQGRGARYTRANPPVRILAFRPYPDRASASRAEWQLKQLPRARKLAWLQQADDHAVARR
ncbi:GIY-YIG nuclease family protein [Stenotrophomonas sp. YIM B06876]|uniref:GIY-YIG nuclease family protein n=1 Tax=Stenotrophomonas sp. YIM B06876 TaxID=3060211 RepID=UPI00273A56B9|nr:GIY-YIG nuclease family protein [Stenotrophomonas sp. YIM B06876]